MEDLMTFKYRHLLFVFSIAASSFTRINFTAGAEVASFALSVTDFSALSRDEQKILLFEAFTHRIAHGRNIYYDSLLVMRNHRFVDGEMKEIAWRGLKYGYRHWRLGDSFVVETQLYGDPANEVSLSTHRSNYDASSGVVKATADSQNLKVGLGAISPRKDPIWATNRYGYWLDGEKNGFAEYLFRELVSLRDFYSIRTRDGDQFIELDVPWHPRGFPNADGKWTYVLDSSKGFIPIEGRGHWESTDARTGKKGGQAHWRTEHFWVKGMKLVGDVWMPTELKEIVRASTAKKDVATIYETKIIEIEHGNVRSDDLAVEFGDRRRVVDKIEGASFLTDPHGEPRPGTKVSILERAPLVAPKAARSFSIVFIALFNVLVLVLYLGVRRKWKFWR
jgi:hypothetical protein